MAVIIQPPTDLPDFASFAISLPSDPLPRLHPAEQELVTSSMVAARREAFVRGRTAAHTALQKIDLDTGPILQRPDRSPIWPSGATGSISHAAGFGVALVAAADLTDGVGIDIEHSGEHPELWEEVPVAQERVWLSHLDGAARERQTLGLFSAKESVFKAFYPRVGSFFGFEMASMRPSTTGFIGHLRGGLDRDYPSDRSFSVTCNWFEDIVMTTVVLPKTGSS